MSGSSSRSVRYPKYQDTNLLQLCFFGFYTIETFLVLLYFVCPGILIAGGKGPGSETTELFIVETGQTCSLPSLPSPRIDHSLDVMNSMPVLCGDSFENDVGKKSCLKFSPLSDCGSWRNFTTLQYDLGYSGIAHGLFDVNQQTFSNWFRNLHKKYSCSPMGQK